MTRARVDYDPPSRRSARHRRSDPRIAARIHAAPGDARAVLNVGAGTGSYEPSDRWVVAVELNAASTRWRRRSAVGSASSAYPPRVTAATGSSEPSGAVRRRCSAPSVRRAQSMWAVLAPGVEDEIVERLGCDLRSGAWDARHGQLRAQATFAGSLRLVLSEPAEAG